MTSSRKHRVCLAVLVAAAVLAVGSAADVAAQSLQGPDGESLLHPGQTLVLQGAGFGTGPDLTAGAAPDSTGPRVELGDAADYSACERRVLQAVTSWSDNQIVLTVDSGPFAPETPVWAHIIGFDGGDGMVLESARLDDPDGPDLPGRPGAPVRQ